ncbi:hypothetical protein CEXT_139501 [Caerostris extrusa]|uniref:Uncharacterized protein n=1 Tax=Caerostris extrusa TaxID=172846 RepID=A0AAV4T7L2_CAEEX|nr:hypothetical protein CEXT_139501 [Caerostris extrusa]
MDTSDGNSILEDIIPNHLSVHTHNRVDVYDSHSFRSDSHETPTADRLNGFSRFEGPFYLVPGASVSDEVARYLSNSDVEGSLCHPINGNEFVVLDCQKLAPRHTSFENEWKNFKTLLALLKFDKHLSATGKFSLSNFA